MVEPHGVLNDLGREPVAFVQRMTRLRASMLVHSTLTCHNPPKDLIGPRRPIDRICIRGDQSRQDNELIPVEDVRSELRNGTSRAMSLGQMQAFR